MRLAFGNKARSGKDTAAEHLAAKYGGIVLHFSDPIYAIAGLIQDLQGTTRHKDTQLLQRVGTLVRDTDVDLCKKYMHKKIYKLGEEQPGVNMFVADVRFPNELEMLRQVGFTLVHVNRPGRPIDRDPDHPSENAVSPGDFDVNVDNTGSLAEYLERVDAIGERELMALEDKPPHKRAGKYWLDLSPEAFHARMKHIREVEIPKYHARQERVRRAQATKKLNKERRSRVEARVEYQG